MTTGEANLLTMSKTRERAQTQETVAGLGPTVLYMFLPPKSRITGRYHMVWPVAGFVTYIGLF